MKLSEIIINFRKTNNLSARKFAMMCGLSNAYISLIENESTKSPTFDTIKKIASAMNMDVNELIKILDDDTLINVKAISKPSDEEIYKNLEMDYIKIPLYSSICCGNGGFNEDNILEYIPVPSKGLINGKKYFGQYAEGDSMKDAGIGDGDLLVFERVSRVDNGVIGCFCVDINKAMCKKYKEENGIVMLQPMNSNYDSIPIDPVNGNFRCIGKLKKVIKDFDWED